MPRDTSGNFRQDDTGEKQHPYHLPQSTETGGHYHRRALSMARHAKQERIAEGRRSDREEQQEIAQQIQAITERRGDYRPQHPIYPDTSTSPHQQAYHSLGYPEASTPFHPQAHEQQYQPLWQTPSDHSTQQSYYSPTHPETRASISQQTDWEEVDRIEANRRAETEQLLAFFGQSQDPSTSTQQQAAPKEQPHGSRVDVLSSSAAEQEHIPDKRVSDLSEGQLSALKKIAATIHYKGDSRGSQIIKIYYHNIARCLERVLRNRNTSAFAEHKRETIKWAEGTTEPPDDPNLAFRQARNSMDTAFPGIRNSTQRELQGYANQMKAMLRQ